MDNDTLQLILSRFDKLEEKFEKRIDSFAENIREESVLTRQDMNKVKRDINALKTKFAIIALSLGMAGGKLAEFLPFLK